MDELEGMVCIAVATQRWFNDSTPFNFHGDAIPTDVTLEVCLAHLRDQSRRSDHHPADRDQLIYVLWVQ